MVVGLSFRAAARRVGCTHRAISVAVRSGRIALQADGTILPDAVDAWHASRRARRGGSRRADTAREVAATAAVAGQAATPGRAEPLPPISMAPILPTLPASVLAGGIFADRATAELARDSFMARLRQLEYEERSGRLLDADRVREAITAACARVRTRLLAIPAERAVAVARLRTAPEVQNALQAAVTEALEELAISFAPTAESKS
jgi:hypothetical protein